RRALDLAPLQGVEPTGRRHAWLVTGDRPQFVSRDLYLRIPKGWCHVYVALRAPACSGAALYVDVGRGFGREPTIEIPAEDLDGTLCVARIPATAVGLRLDPLAAGGEIELG